MSCVLLPSCYLCAFSFESSAAHRDLHSFPTRRSSDLSPATLAKCWPSPSVRTASALPPQARTAPSAPAVARRSPRSEEHTSELQSLRHLVCRLLLEKKKTPNANRERKTVKPITSTDIL